MAPNLQFSDGVDADVKEAEEVLTPNKTKKRKVGADMNRKPGEKRQNKYFWAKIDAPRPNTPAPKTPKRVIPKPRKKKDEKSKPVKLSKVSIKRVNEKPIQKSTCKKSLLFDSTDLEPCNVPNPLVESIVEKTANDVHGLNLGDADVAPKLNITENKAVVVYHRRLKSKCVYNCRNLMPKFPTKKRVQKNRKSLALKIFEGLNTTGLAGNLHDRMLIVKGKLRMVMPTNEEFSQDLFYCVVRSLVSRMRWPIRKKRNPRLWRRTKQVVNLDESTSTLAHPLPPTNEPLNDENNEPLKDENNGENVFKAQHGLNCDVNMAEHEVKLMQLWTHQCLDGEQTCNDVQHVNPIPSTSKSPAEGCKGGKTNVIKEKNAKRTYKKKKEDAFWTELPDRPNDAAVEEIIEKIAHEFEKLVSLYPDPKTYHIVVVNDQNDGFYEEMKFREERANLSEKIAKFLQEMYYYQGSKRFVKWNGSVLDSVVGVFLTQNVSDILSSNAYMCMASKYPIKPPISNDTGIDDDQIYLEATNSQESVSSYPKVIVEHPDDDENEVEDTKPDVIEETTPEDDIDQKAYLDALKAMEDSLPELLESKRTGRQAQGVYFVDWNAIRNKFSKMSERKPENKDSVDWEAVRKANVRDIAEVIRPRGQHHIIAAKIQRTLNRLVDEHGSLDLEWLRDAPAVVGKAYLLSFYGLGLKSVECLRLLTLHQDGFPVDVNIGRIVVRLGWVPIKPLPAGLPFHLLQKYPLEDEIQKYLLPRIRHLRQETLYHLHYQMITFGKVFCHKRSPNCRACPFKSDCKYYASLSESNRLALPWKLNKNSKKSKKREKIPNPFDLARKKPLESLPYVTSNINSCSEIYDPSSNDGSSLQLSTTFDNVSQTPEYFVEMPSSPKPEDEEEERIRNSKEAEVVDIEDCCDGYMYHLKLKTGETKLALVNYNQESNMPNQNFESREMVRASPNAGFLPKQVNVSRLRTEHQVYELARGNRLLYHLNLEPQMGDVPYLLAIWTDVKTGQTEKTCNSTEACPCSSESECTSREDSSTIPGTLLIPVQTAMRMSFPLNGTYFQMNEVFVDKETSRRPINVPTRWIWNCRKRTLYCGSSTSVIVKGTTEMEIRECFREGFVCTRGFNRQTRAPTTLPNRFHFRKGKPDEDDQD